MGGIFCYHYSVYDYAKLHYELHWLDTPSWCMGRVRKCVYDYAKLHYELHWLDTPSWCMGRVRKFV